MFDSKSSVAFWFYQYTVTNSVDLHSGTSKFPIKTHFLLSHITSLPVD